MTDTSGDDPRDTPAGATDEAAVQQARVDARATYRALEPLHAFIYFDAGAAERYTAAGLKGGHMQYFASRAAAMGAVGPGPVAATFFNFNPAVVERALPAAWTFAPVDAVLAARHDAAADVYTAVFDDSSVVGEALELLAPAVAAVRPLMAGRALAAAHADLPEPTDPLRLLWWRLTVLREWRGDGHVAALTVDGMDPVEVLQTHIAAGGVNADVLRMTRAWPDDRWAAAAANLRDRGEIDDAGALTPAGSARRQAVEEHTDALAAAPWLALGSDRTARLRELLQPYAAKVFASSGLSAMITSRGATGS